MTRYCVLLERLHAIPNPMAPRPTKPMDVIVFFVVVKIIPEVCWKESKDLSQSLQGEEKAAITQDWKRCVVSETCHVVTG